LLQVDVTAMVPTVVVGLLQHLAAHNSALRSLKRLVIGGAAAPRSMIETLER
jgi:fatty-acyl-CoA synthase